MLTVDEQPLEMYVPAGQLVEHVLHDPPVLAVSWYVPVPQPAHPMLAVVEHPLETYVPAGQLVEHDLHDAAVLAAS